jgi:hypothetical protein
MLRFAARAYLKGVKNVCIHINGWKTGKTAYGTYTNDHTTWVQEDRGGGKARQGRHPPHPKFWRGKLVKIERTDKKNQTEKKKLKLKFL